MVLDGSFAWANAWNFRKVWKKQEEGGQAGGGAGAEAASDDEVAASTISRTGKGGAAGVTESVFCFSLLNCCLAGCLSFSVNRGDVCVVLCSGQKSFCPAVFITFNQDRTCIWWKKSDVDIELVCEGKGGRAIGRGAGLATRWVILRSGTVSAGFGRLVPFRFGSLNHQLNAIIGRAVMLW